jgi:outer membrane protein assembly factor BamB
MFVPGAHQRANASASLELLLSIVLLGTIVGNALAVEQWGRFRGPNGSGVSEDGGIPVVWTDADYRWKVQLPGVGSSSPVTWCGRVFVTSASEETGNQYIQCLRTNDGSEVWRREYPGAVYPKHKFNHFAASTPVVAGGQLFATWVTPEGYLAVGLDLDGKEMWRRNLGPFVAEHGFGASPVVYKDLVILPNDQDGTSSVIALDRQSGETRWQVQRRTEKTAYATPCFYTPDGGSTQLILASWAHGLSGHDPLTGKTLWELPVFQHRVVASPTIASGLIVQGAGTGGAGKRMVAVRPADPDKEIEAKVVYEVDSAIPYVPVPVCRGDRLFLWSDKGIVACLEAGTGKVIWRERVGGDYFSSPICVGDRLYNSTRDGKMMVVAATDKFEKLGEIDLGEATNSTPALSVGGGTMYVRTYSHLMAVGRPKTP